MKSSRPRSSAAAETADDTNRPATPTAPPHGRDQPPLLVHVGAKEIGAPRRRRKTLLGATRQISRPCEKELVRTCRAVAVNKRARFEVAHGSLVQMNTARYRTSPDKPYREGRLCRRARFWCRESIQAGASPGRTHAASNHRSHAANTNGIRQHLVAASRTKKTHPPEGDPLATLIDTPPVTRWQASGT